ncbi:MAG: hypothetical protein E7415_05440 [Ruminococcaceae bacterium]|nr:hypothetical protein [Oscillospiraceae bacterium]
MAEIDKTVIKETKYIAYWVIVMSAVMQAVFIIIGKWNYTVLLGNLLTAVADILNFLIMGVSVQKALEKDKDGARRVMKVSQRYRMLFILVIVIAGVSIPFFDNWAVIIPLFFPRIAVAFRPLMGKRNEK